MTAKQKAVAKKLLENPGKSIGSAMREAGYSPATAKNPSDLTESKGWKQLLEKYLPDTDLLEVGRQGLQATKLATSFTEADSFIPDWPTRHRYFETALKLKKYLGPDSQVNVLNQGDMSLELVGHEESSA